MRRPVSVVSSSRKTMLFDKLRLPIHPAALGTTVGVSLTVLLFGILRAQAVPAGKQAGGKSAVSKPRFVPVPAAKARPASATPRNGEKIYRELCAPCHGANGEGGKGYRMPLTGEESVGGLSRFIASSMPPDAKTKLPADEAKKVAAYIHETFYSPVAQMRNKPPRVELSRLTVRQYSNAVTDLLGSFRKSEPVDEKRGLRAKYFKARRAKETVLERVDPEIRFDFGTGSALPAQDDPYQFEMHWQGSVVAPETGEYEFIIRTEQAATLWINDLQEPLIDGRVKSGDGNDYRARLFLLGGRHYPLRLEFFKGVTGVDNLKKLKEKPSQRATLTLQWKMPHRSIEVIPQHCLLPVVAPRMFVLTTPFPPDDRSIGYERGNLVSKEWDAAATEAAFEVAGYVWDNLRELSGVADDAPDRDARLRAFCRQFTSRAFRRPLSDEQAKFFITRQFENAPNLETAIKRVVLLTLKSPRFLYREVEVPEAGATALPAALETASAARDPYDIAARLSFVLWDSLPDEALLKAAANGKLSTRAEVLQQAERMVKDPRTRSKVRAFLLQWLKVEHYPDLAKDAKRFPKFNESVASDLRTSFEMTLEDVVWSEKSDFRELLLTDKFFLNGRLALMYGENLTLNAPFQPVAMDGGRRNGLLTHPYLLSSLAYLDTSSPIHRGVLIARSLLGRTLQPPPEAFTPIPANLHPKLTTRQRVAMQTKPPACASCHTMINPLGFSLEKFDAVGALRTHENGAPVDSSGGYRSRSGEQLKFADAGDLATFLANSDEVHVSFVQKLFHNLVKQPIKAYGPQTQPGLLQAFKTNNFSVRQQIIETAVTAALGPQDAKQTSQTGTLRANNPHRQGGTPRT
jgi:mono/diheme cytochrome c family protein